MDVELNQHWREMPFNITVQCNGKVKRTKSYVCVENAEGKWQWYSTTEWKYDGNLYDTDIYSHIRIATLLKVFKELWYDISMEYHEVQKMIVVEYLKNKVHEDKSILDPTIVSTN